MKKLLLISNSTLQGSRYLDHCEDQVDSSAVGLEDYVHSF